MADRLITPNFKLSEFACKEGTPYPDKWITERLLPLCQMDEIIRAAFDNHPLTILCGYRSPEYNERLRKKGLQGEEKKTGVAQHSQHMEGRANDIVIFGVATVVLHERILDLYGRGKLPMLGGVGLYRDHGFVHVDTFKDPDGHLRRWIG